MGRFGDHSRGSDWNLLRKGNQSRLALRGNEQSSCMGTSLRIQNSRVKEARGR